VSCFAVGLMFLGIALLSLFVRKPIGVSFIHFPAKKDTANIYEETREIYRGVG